MKTIKNTILVLLIFSGIYASQGQTVTVSTEQAFINALSSGNSTILLKAGTYRFNGIYTINGKTVKPENSSAVVYFTGTSSGNKFLIKAENGATLQGVYFKDIHTTSSGQSQDYVVELRKSTLLECIFDGRNITRSGKFVRAFEGGTKIYNNTFYDQWNGGLLVLETDHIETGSDAIEDERYNIIENLYSTPWNFHKTRTLHSQLDASMDIGGFHVKGNYFFNPKVHTVGGHSKNGNGKFAIKTGNGEVCFGYNLIEENLFHDCSAEGEIVEGKGKHQLFRYNTFYKCDGGLSLRHGSHSLVYSNYFIEGSDGIYFWGPNHHAANNYFYKISERPLTFHTGKNNTVFDKPMHITYVKAHEIMVTNNTFVDCARMQFNYGLGWESRTQKVSNIRFTNNVFHKSSNNNMFDNHNGSDQDIRNAIVTWKSNIMNKSDNLADDIIPSSEDAIFKNSQNINLTTRNYGEYSLKFPSVQTSWHQKSASLPSNLNTMHGRDGNKNSAWLNQDTGLSKDMNGKNRNSSYKGLGAFTNTPSNTDLGSFPGRALRPSDVGLSFLGAPVLIGGGSNPGGGTNNPPSVSFTQPTNNQSFEAGGTVVVNVAASDEGSVTNVKLYLNGTFVRQESTAPYDWSHTADLDPELKNMTAGTYTLKAIAEDNTGLTAETSISFIVNPSGGGTCNLPWSTGNISVTQRTENYSSGVIDISECGNVEISMDLQGVGPMETSDYCNVYYKLNGGAQVAISENTNAFASKTVSANVSGNTVELIINAYTSYSDETYNISNISISEDSGPVVISNLALNKPATASSTPEPANGPANAVDGNTNTRWSATGFPQWLEVDLGEVKSISKTELVCYADRAYQFVVEAKTTSTGSYTQIVNRSSNTQGGSVASPMTDNFTAVNARYVRIAVSGASGYTGTWTSLQEFRVFGTTMKSTIKNSLSLSEVNVFPNPFYDMLLVDLGAREFSMLRLVDISGRTLLTKDIRGLETTEIDISSEAGVLNTGIYYVVLEGASDIQSIKVFKSN